MRPSSLKLAAAAGEANASEIVWIPSAGHTGVLMRDGATFVVAVGCAVPGRMPWWMFGTVLAADGRSVDFAIDEHEDEETALAVALVFLTEAPVPAVLQQPPHEAPETSN